MKIAESLAPEVLRSVLTTDAVVALEHDERIWIQTEQCIVMRLIEQARTVNLRDRTFLDRADVDQLKWCAALDQCLQLRS